MASKDQIQAIAITPLYRPVYVPGLGSVPVGEERIVRVSYAPDGSFAPGSHVPALLALVACDPPRAAIRIPDPSELVDAEAVSAPPALDIAGTLKLQIERERAPKALRVKVSAKVKADGDLPEGLDKL